MGTERRRENDLLPLDPFGTLTLPKTDIDPENGPLEECFPLLTSQPVVFRVHVSLPGRRSVYSSLVHEGIGVLKSVVCLNPQQKIDILQATLIGPTKIQASW